MATNAQRKLETENLSDAGSAPIATVTVTIAGIDVALPVKFSTGHILSDAEAKVIDAAYRRQFANNQNAAFASWEKKAKEWDAKPEGERPVNPCTESKMQEVYVSYVPQVGQSQQTALEKMRIEAGLLVL